MDKQELYLEIWKRSRDSVEHFDRILTELRKTLIMINGAALPILVSFFISPLPDKKMYIALFSFALNLIDIVFWFVEKHYHIYLIVSANTAKKAEDVLDIGELGLTKCLGSKKLRIPFVRGYLSFYDFLYILPAAISMAIAFFTPSLTHRIVFGLFLIFEMIFGVYVLNKNIKTELQA